MNRIIYIITFFLYAGYYAVMAFTVAFGLSSISRIITIPLRLITSFLMIFVIIKLLKTNVSSYKKKIFYFMFITFWALYFIKVLYNYYIEVPLMRNWYEYLFFALNFCILPFLMYSLIDFSKYKKTILNALIFSGFAMGVASIFIYKELIVIGVSRLSMAKYVNPDIEVLNPLILSYVSSLTIALCFYQLFFNKKEISLKYKIYLYINILLAFVMFFLGASRGSLLALLLCFPLFLLYSKGRKKIKFIAILVASFPIIILGAIKMGSGIFQRTANSFDGAGTGREELWSNAWNEFLNNPIFGGRIEINFYPHNFILESLMATGIFGFIFLMIILSNGFKKVYNISFRDKNYIWVFIILIQGFSQYFFTAALYNAILLFFPLGLIYSSTREMVPNK